MTSIPEASAEVTFKHIVAAAVDLFRFLLSKWVILVIFGITGGIIGIVYAWSKKPSYEATLTFSTDNDNGGSAGGLMGLAAQFGFDIGGGGNVFAGDNIVALMQSRKIISATLHTPINYKAKKESLLNVYLAVSGRQKAYQNSTTLKNISFPITQDPATYSRVQDSILLSVVSTITKDVLKVDRPDKKIEMYQLTCISPDEIFSKEFALQLIKRVSEFYIENKTKRSQFTVDILQKRTDSIRLAFDAALAGRASMTDANLNPAFLAPQVGIQKKQADITVLSTAYGELLKNLELAKFNLLRETPLITVIDEPVLPLQNLQMGKLIGGIIGGFVFGVLGVGYILIRRTLKEIQQHT